MDDDDAAHVSCYLAKLAARQIDAAILNWEMAVSKGPPRLLLLAVVKKTHRLADSEGERGKKVCKERQ